MLLRGRQVQRQQEDQVLKNLELHQSREVVEELAARVLAPDQGHEVRHVVLGHEVRHVVLAVPVVQQVLGAEVRRLVHRLLRK